MIELATGRHGLSARKGKFTVEIAARCPHIAHHENRSICSDSYGCPLIGRHFVFHYSEMQNVPDVQHVQAGRDDAKPGAVRQTDLRDGDLRAHGGGGQ
jgi:hypothetical protein